MTIEEQAAEVAGDENRRLMDATLDDFAYLYRKLLGLMSENVGKFHAAADMSDLQQARALDYSWYLMVRALGATQPAQQHVMVLEGHDH